LTLEIECRVFVDCGPVYELSKALQLVPRGPQRLTEQSQPTATIIAMFYLRIKGGSHDDHHEALRSGMYSHQPKRRNVVESITRTNITEPGETRT
jgi:hypothetical protein